MKFHLLQGTLLHYMQNKLEGWALDGVSSMCEAVGLNIGTTKLKSEIKHRQEKQSQFEKTQAFLTFWEVRYWASLFHLH